MEVKYVGTTPHTLPDGHILQPEQSADVDGDHPELKPLLDSGRLIPLEPEPEPSREELQARAKELDIPANQSNDALKEAIAVKEAEGADDENNGEEGSQ